MNTQQETQLKKHISNSLSGDDRWFCKDCGKDCHLDAVDYYMVTNDVWKEHGVGLGMLCMNCIEERIGHKLTINEILPCVLTELLNPYTMAILKSGQHKMSIESQTFLKITMHHFKITPHEN